MTRVSPNGHWLRMDRTLPGDFRRQAASALMHPVTLGALAVLLVNDLVFKALWPGAWVPGKLSDLAWMMFAPPVLAFVLSFARLGSPKAQRAAFLTAYAGLPLLYVAFNTFAPVHDAILLVLGLFGGDGPRSPLDPTDSIVIPVAMAAAIWVWRRPPLEAQSIRTRLALLAAVAAALASVATSYDDRDRGIERVGRTNYGALAADFAGGPYQSRDGGLTWGKAGQDWVALETRKLMELGEKEPSGIFSTGDIRITNNEVLSSGDVIYSFEYLQGDGNRWMQGLDKREIIDREITTRPLDFFYDGRSGNLILAMGLQGVVVIAPDGTTTKVAVGRHSPTDFSFWSKTRMFFSSLVFGDYAVYIGLAVLLAFSFASLALASSEASKSARWAIAPAAAISAFLTITWGVYPHTNEHHTGPESTWVWVGSYAILLSGVGLVPFLLAVRGLAIAGISRRQLRAIVAATIGMLLLIWIGALVLFETGPLIANFVAVGLVGLAAFGLWAYQKRRRHG